MANLFLILFMVSFIALVVGLIRPSAVSRFFRHKLGRKKISLIFGSATFAFMIFFGVTTDTSDTQPGERVSNTNATTVNTNISAVVANTNTTKDIQLTITQPKWGIVTTSSQVILKGKVVPSTATITVNGKSAIIATDGSYSITLDLPSDEAVDKDPEKGGVFLEVIARAGELEKKQSGYITKIPSDEYRLQAQEAEFDKTPAGIICVAHPQWTHDDCQMLADNKIWIGMSYDMLVYKRGKPNSVNPSNYGYGTQYQYCWNNFTPSCFYDKNEDNLMDSYN